MVRIAREKAAGKPILVAQGDAETARFDHPFDVIMLYNAFPHFPNPAALIASLASQLKPGGRLSIAHGMSRARVNHVHSGAAAAVSNGLMPEGELVELMRPFFDIDVIISNERMYQVCGALKRDLDDDAAQALHALEPARASYLTGHVHENTRAVLNRLSRAIGHLKSVQRMVEDGRDCSEVLIQLAAVRSAIENTGKVILQDHLEHCIVEAVRDNNQEALDDLYKAIDKFIK